MDFTVISIDNYNTFEPTPGIKRCFTSLEEALSYCRIHLDAFLQQHRDPGMSGEDLFLQHLHFGEEFIVLHKGVRVPEWDSRQYMRERCMAITPRVTHLGGLIIDTDYGGAWGWNFHPDNRYLEGSNVCDSNYWSLEETPVPQRLIDQIADWQLGFERCDDFETFDWQSFNLRGIELTRRLKWEVGNAMSIVYLRPYEDQCPHQAGIGAVRRFFIWPDGGVTPYIHRPQVNH